MKKMIDMKVVDGRLINNMPTNEMGITKVSRMAAAANAQAEGFEGTQYNTQGYMRGGKSGSIKLFTNNNILEASTGTRGGGSYGNAVETNATYEPVNYRDVAREIKRYGSDVGAFDQLFEFDPDSPIE